MEFIPNLNCDCGGTIQILKSARKGTPIGHCDVCGNWFDLGMKLREAPEPESPWRWNTLQKIHTSKISKRPFSSAKYQKFYEYQRLQKNWGAVIARLKQKHLRGFRSPVEFRNYRWPGGFYLSIFRFYIQIYKSRGCKWTINCGFLPKMGGI